MESIVTIKKGSVPYALLFKAIEVTDGVRFLTEPDQEFQTGIMERPAGYVIKPHTHPRDEKVIHGLSEFLYMEKGSIRVTVYDEEWKVLGTETLGPRDFLLFFRGGHGIEILEDCRMIEVKQGPYPGAAAAKSFQPGV